MRASKRGEKHREIENCKIYMGEDNRAVSENKKIVFLCLICIFKYFFFFDKFVFVFVFLSIVISI